MVFYKIKEVAQNFIYFWIFFITFFGFPDFKPQNLNQRILFHRNLSNDPERKRNAFAGKYSKIRNIRKNVKFHRIFIELIKMVKTFIKRKVEKERQQKTYQKQCKKQGNKMKNNKIKQNKKRKVEKIRKKKEKI